MRNRGGKLTICVPALTGTIDDLIVSRQPHHRTVRGEVSPLMWDIDGVFSRKFMHARLKVRVMNRILRDGDHARLGFIILKSKCNEIPRFWNLQKRGGDKVSTNKVRGGRTTNRKARDDCSRKERQLTDLSNARKKEKLRQQSILASLHPSTFFFPHWRQESKSCGIELAAFDFLEHLKFLKTGLMRFSVTIMVLDVLSHVWILFPPFPLEHHLPNLTLLTSCSPWGTHWHAWDDVFSSSSSLNKEGHDHADDFKRVGPCCQSSFLFFLHLAHNVSSLAERNCKRKRKDRDRDG